MHRDTIRLSLGGLSGEWNVIRCVVCSTVPAWCESPQANTFWLLLEAGKDCKVNGLFCLYEGIKYFPLVLFCFSMFSITRADFFSNKKACIKTLPENTTRASFWKTLERGICRPRGAARARWYLLVLIRFCLSSHGRSFVYTSSHGLAGNRCLSKISLIPLIRVCSLNLIFC